MADRGAVLFLCIIKGKRYRSLGGALGSMKPDKRWDCQIEVERDDGLVLACSMGVSYRAGSRSRASMEENQD